MPHLSDDDLFDRTTRWPHDGGLTDMTLERLRDIAAAEGIDFATALLYDRIMTSEEYGPAIEQLDALSESSTEPFPDDVTLAIAPGAFYVQFPHTGADGRLLREEGSRLRLKSELIPTSQFGPLADNARIISDWLRNQPADERIVLISLSKGGPDVKMALAQPDADQVFRNVAVWINLSGLLWGTPLVEWLLQRRLRTLWVRFLFWLRGFEFNTLHDLTSGPGTPLDFPLHLPHNMQAIHVVGFPREHHLTNRLARRCFRRVQNHGPNDGAGIVLGNVTQLPGIVYPLWGADHYLRPNGIDAHSLARRLLAAARNIVMEHEPCLTAGRDRP